MAHNAFGQAISMGMAIPPLCSEYTAAMSVLQLSAQRVTETPVGVEPTNRCFAGDLPARRTTSFLKEMISDLWVRVFSDFW